MKMPREQGNMSNLEFLTAEYVALGEADAMFQRMAAMIEGFQGAQKQGDDLAPESYGAEWARAMQWLAIKELEKDCRAFLAFCDREL
jgi:hypothetical protein